MEFNTDLFIGILVACGSVIAEMAIGMIPNKYIRYKSHIIKFLESINEK